MADNLFNDSFLSKSELNNLNKLQNNLEKITSQRILNNELSEEEIKNINSILEKHKQQLRQEAELNAIKDKSLDQIESILKNKEYQIQLLIQQKRHELDITENEQDKIELQSELNDLIKDQENINNRIQIIDESSVISANRLLFLDKQRKQLLSDITKKKKEQADEDKKAYEALLKRKMLGEDVSDEEISTAKNKAEKSQSILGGVNTITKIVENAVGMLSKFSTSLLQKMDSAINMYSDYKGIIDARLQTISDTNAKTFDSINSMYQGQLKTTGYLSYTDLISNVDKLSKAGISYNIEERAFLETISDKMVASFDTLDGNLTRLIRLQQADMTRLALGNEATLTRLFNEFFEDTSYLAGNVSDSVAGAILDASGTMNVSDSSAFQFAVQKWLGALYEVGLSDTTVGSIAQAINLLGTGQASAFTDSSLSTLLNMSIARGDYSLSDVLTQGLNVDFIDDLMSSMVTLLTDIKNNTSSQVTLAAYADIFGISMSDLRAFVNLKDDIATLKAYNQTSEEAEQAVKDQITMLEQRTTFAEKIDNVINNLSYIVGENIADSNTQYVIYKLGTIVQQLGQGTTLGLAGTADIIGSVMYGLNEYGAELNFGKERSWFGNAVHKVLDAVGLDLINDVIDFFGNINTAVLSVFQGFNTDSLLNMQLSSPYVRYERGAAYSGVAPSYGSVTNSLSSSMGVVVPIGVGSTESYYGLTVKPESSNMTTYDKIASLSDVEDLTVNNVVSTETSEILSKNITLQDIYTELFINQDYPLRVHISHFDDKAMGQLKGDAHMDDNNIYLKALYTYANGLGIPVEIGNSDVSTLMSGMYNIRES